MISLLEENQWLNPNLSKQTINNLKKSEFTFNRMLNELAILHECIENNTLHLAEFKLSVGTRKTLREIYKRNQQISDISLLIEAASDPVSTADTSKNILSLINKFHGDNKSYLDNFGSDARLKDTSIPKNIGSEPSIIQKAALKTKELGGKAGQIAMNLFQSIVVNAFTRFVNWSSSLKSDILDAKKQGSAWQMIMTKLGPSMKIAKRAPDGTITYENDSSGKSTLDQLQNFTKLNPKWTNTIIGLLINITKMLSVSFAGASVGTSLAIGVLVGLLIRTIVGHYLKKESWGNAFKNALVVTGLSLVGGSLTKGLFSYFKGGGFIDGAKSYFVGSPGSDQFSDAATLSENVKVSEPDISKLMVAPRPGADPALLKIISTNQKLLDAFKAEVSNQNFEESISGIKEFLKWADTQDIMKVVNSAGGLPKNALATIVKQTSAVTGDVTAAIAGKSVNEIGKAALNGQIDSSLYMQSYIDTFGVGPYRILLKALQAGIIKPEQFYSGAPLKFNALLVGDKIPLSINGVNVIGTLTKDEAASALAGYQMKQEMGGQIDVNILNQLAKQAGETLKESVYKTLIKKLYI